MKIRLGSIPLYLAACREICTLSLPLRTAAKAARTSEALGKAAAEYVKREREINEKYLGKEPDGSLKIRYGTYVFDESRKEEYLSEIREYRAREMDLPLDSFRESEFGDVRITPDGYRAMLPLLEKGETR